jgi:hypothetical protein
MSLLLRIAALVVFVLVVVFVIFVDWQLTTYIALLAAGLASWVASTLVADTVRVVQR